MGMLAALCGRALAVGMALVLVAQGTRGVGVDSGMAKAAADDRGLVP